MIRMDERADALRASAFDVQSEENAVPVVLTSGNGYENKRRREANQCDGGIRLFKKLLDSRDQKIRSCLRRLPKPPTLAMMNEIRY